MTTQRLPIPGGDNGDWGTILNSFLEVSLNPDGTLKSSATGATGSQGLTGATGPQGATGSVPTGTYVPLGDQFAYVAASGDTTGATDYAAISTQLALGRTVLLYQGTDYYFNTQLLLAGANGLDIPPNTKLHWTGAKNTVAISTVPYTDVNQANYTGSITGGGTIFYPGPITSGAGVIYVAQPYFSVPPNVNIHIGGNTNPVVSNTFGWDLDGCSSAAQFEMVNCDVSGPVATAFKIRCWHATLVACSAFYGNDAVQLANDSLGNGPADILLLAFQAYNMSNSFLRLTNGATGFSSCKVVGGMNEGASNSGGYNTDPIPLLVYIDSTFSGWADVDDVQLQGNIPALIGNPEIAHYSTTGTVRIRGTQPGIYTPMGYDGTFIGQVSGVPIPIGDVTNYSLTQDNTAAGFSNPSTTVVVAYSASGFGPFFTGPSRKFRLTLTCSLTNETANDHCQVSVVQFANTVTPPLQGAAAPPGSTTRINQTFISATANAAIPVTIVQEFAYGAPVNTAPQYFCVCTSAPDGGRTDISHCQLRVECL